MPTFKLEEGTKNYIFSRPKKLPSYTDRVIYRYTNVKSDEGKKVSTNKVIVEDYHSMKIYMSDHLPVIFTSKVYRTSTKHHI